MIIIVQPILSVHQQDDLCPNATRELRSYISSLNLNLNSKSLSHSRPCKRHVDRQDDQTALINPSLIPSPAPVPKNNKNLESKKKVWGIK